MFDSDETYAQITLPLRQLTHKNAHFKCTPACEQSYDQIIRTVTSETALRPFDPQLQTVLVTDGSLVGIAATVTRALSSLSIMQVGCSLRQKQGTHPLRGNS